MSEYTWSADAFDAIRITAANGEFHINGVEGNKVLVEGSDHSRRSFGTEPRIVGRWLYLNPFGGGSEWSVDLPRSKAWTIQVQCASGEVEIEDVHARIEVQLGSGDVNVENCRGTFNVRAGSGDVRMENCSQSEVPAAPEQPATEQEASMPGMPPGVPPIPPTPPPGMSEPPPIPPVPPIPPFGVNVRVKRGRHAEHPDEWEEYGQEWEEWGERFGAQVSNWAENLSRSFSFGFKFSSEDEVQSDGLHVRLGSGDVQLEEIDALVVSARVGNGDVQIEQGRIAELDVENSRGDVQIEGVLPTKAWELVTRHGDVHMVLPGDAYARIDAATRHGDIDCDAPLVRVGRPGPGSRHGGRMVGTIGEGQGEPVDIHLESQHGDIHIEVERRPSRYQGKPAQPGSAPAEQRTNKAEGSDVVQRVRKVEVIHDVQDEADVSEPTAAQAESRSTPASGGQVYDSQMAILQALRAGEISVTEAELLLRTLK